MRATPVESRIAALAQKNPDACALAELASLAVRIEPELLRALRLLALPAADVAAETDLWWSELVEIRGTAAITLTPDAAAQLRTNLAQDRARLEHAYQILRQLHVQRDLLSLEEELIFRALADASMDDVEARLHEVLAAMISTPDVKLRDELAAWALRAGPHLPERARTTSAAWLLLLEATHLYPVGLPQLPEKIPDSLLADFHAASMLPGVAPVWLKLRFGDGALIIQRLAEPPADTRDAIAVPHTRPIILKIWPDSEPSAARIEALSEGELRVEIKESTLHIQALDGRSHRVAAPALERADAAAPFEPALVRILTEARVGTGYLIAPNLMVTSTRYLPQNPRERLVVQLATSRRQASVAAADADVDTAILLLDPPVLDVRPLRFMSILQAAGRYRTAVYLDEASAPVPFGGYVDWFYHEGGPETPRMQVRLPDDIPLEAALGVPLIVGDQVVGHISAAGVHPGYGRPAEVQVTPATYVARLVEEVTRRDSLVAQEASEYETTRSSMPKGNRRTAELDAWVNRIKEIDALRTLPVSALESLFQTGRPGNRMVAIALLQAAASPDGYAVAIEAIQQPRSNFEQYHALVFANIVLDQLPEPARRELRDILRREMDTDGSIRASDPARRGLCQRMLERLEKVAERQDVLRILIVEPEQRGSLLFEQRASKLRHAISSGQHAARIIAHIARADLINQLADLIAVHRPHIVQLSTAARPKSEAFDPEERLLEWASAMLRQAGSIRVLILDGYRFQSARFDWADCVIQVPTSQTAADNLSFLSNFYRVLANGQSVVAAFEIGRSSIAARGSGSVPELHWRSDLSPDQLNIDTLTAAPDKRTVSAPARSKQEPVDILIFTALALERQAVSEHLKDVRADGMENGSSALLGTFAAESRPIRVAVIELGMENQPATIVARSATTAYKPRLVMYVGLASGVRDVKVGDVIVATKVYELEAGKRTDDFIARIVVIETNERFIERARVEMHRTSWLSRARVSLDKADGPSVLVGPIAAGDTVQTSPKRGLYRFLRRSFQDVLAVDMEGRNLLATASHDHIDALTVHGICDLLNEPSKHDDSRAHAANLAAAFAFELIAKSF